MIRRLYIILLFICCFVATEGQVVGDSMYIYRKDKPYHLYDLNEIDYIEFEKSEIQWIRLSDGRLEVYFIKDLDSVSFVKPAPPAPTPGTYTVNGVSFKLVEIEGGTFQMHDYSGIHDVTVGSYSIGETEVTQALWQAVMGNNPSTMYGDDLPVNSVNWDECMTFINKLNELLAPQIGEKKFDFPTEAQWEYAARGGNHSHGYEYSGGNNLDAVAWYENNSNGQIHQVATKTKNELGLYDMSGNVYEWCKELVSDGKRACRGGSWYSEEIECSLSWRDSGTQSGSRDPFSGLRLVLNEKDGGGDDDDDDDDDNTSIKFTVGSVDFKMKHIEGGTFYMGNESVDLAGPVHKVILTKDYYLGETEVTQALWKVVMGNNPSNCQGDDLPVEKVSWSDCHTFIDKLNELTGAKFRLPTEAEWEFAARGGNKNHGYTYSGSNNLDEVAWYGGNTYYITSHPVGTKTPNELGLYDMSGNVWEFCQDYWSDYTNETQYDPIGPDSGYECALRGGGWECLAQRCDVASRNHFFLGTTNLSVGFRLALSEIDGGGDDHENGPTKCTDDNHPHMIDLGLPSGTKWACCNVGASIPEDYGNYYDWGQTEDRLYFDSDTYDNRSLGNDIAGTEYDVAYVRWGSNWCMPNKQQFEELAENTTQRWITQNGVDGMEFEGKNGGKIFLPAGGLACGKDEIHYRDSGHYWSTTQYSYYGGYAHPLYFNCDGIVWNHYLSYMRCWGHSVRPVVKK